MGCNSSLHFLFEFCLLTPLKSIYQEEMNINHGKNEKKWVESQTLTTKCHEPLSPTA